ATVTAGRGAGSASTSPAPSSSRPSPDHTSGRQRPAPSDAVTGSPGRSRRARARWWRSPSSRVGAARSETKTCAALVGRTALLEGTADLGEEPGVLRRHVLPALAGQLAQQRLLLPAQRGRRLDRHLDEQVAPAPPVDVGHAPPPQAEDPSGLGAGRH